MRQSTPKSAFSSCPSVISSCTCRATHRRLCCHSVAIQRCAAAVCRCVSVVHTLRAARGHAYHLQCCAQRAVSNRPAVQRYHRIPTRSHFQMRGRALSVHIQPTCGVASISASSPFKQLPLLRLGSGAVVCLDRTPICSKTAREKSEARLINVKPVIVRAASLVFGPHLPCRAVSAPVLLSVTDVAKWSMFVTPDKFSHNPS